ncbi:T9SS type A sorting domain-containing protein [Hanstruepera ponticola]|uniref:T9SS type A sorting domain-containing protein n=1 Tax=Hanstruepera ponticola TaxID=2042995 RepID=UPI0013C43F65|nr:T9SS type A sorting domain-containing protein [Hanstruepera ponticola]
MNLFNKIISFFTISLLLSSGFISAQSVDLIASADQMPPFTNGQTFNYSIMSTGSPYNALRIKLEYNPSVIQINSLTPVYAFGFTPVNDTSTPGLVKYEAASLSGNITTDEVIFNIEFEVLDNNQAISIAHSYDAADGTVVVNSGGNNILGTANDILLETLSISHNNFESLTIYPNPASNQISIIKSQPFQIKSITLYTLEGKMIMKQSISNQDSNNENIIVDVSSLKNALYFMDVIDQNDYKKTFKVLVSH